MIIQSRTGDYAAVVDYDPGGDGTVTVVLYATSPRQHIGTWRYTAPFHHVCDRVYELINQAPDPSRHVWVPELGRVVDKEKG
jgi:hypothetical protein